MNMDSDTTWLFRQALIANTIMSVALFVVWGAAYILLRDPVLAVDWTLYVAVAMFVISLAWSRNTPAWLVILPFIPVLAAAIFLPLSLPVANILVLFAGFLLTIVAAWALALYAAYRESSVSMTDYTLAALPIVGIGYGLWCVLRFQHRETSSG
jgi:hypothetical protein